MAGFTRLASTVFALCLAASACGDIAPMSSPEAAADGGPAYVAKGRAERVGVLQRGKPLGKLISGSAVIGKAGGRIELPQAGLRVDFPSNALRANTRITITAIPGADVAYSFEPHGIVFAQPVSVRQKLKGTLLGGKTAGQLFGAFFNDSQAISNGQAPALEIIPTDVEVAKDGIRFQIRHFSGYLVSTGRSGYISSTGNVVPVATGTVAPAR